MQGIQIAAPSLATSWKNRRGSRYVAKVVIGGGKEAVCTVPVFKEIFRIFSRDFLFVARRFVDGIFFFQMVVSRNAAVSDKNARNIRTCEDGTSDDAKSNSECVMRTCH